jgi:hypothetical protein
VAAVVKPETKDEALTSAPANEKLAYPPLALHKGGYRPRPWSLSDPTVAKPEFRTDTDLFMDADTKSVDSKHPEDPASSIQPKLALLDASEHRTEGEHVHSQSDPPPRYT